MSQDEPLPAKLRVVPVSVLPPVPANVEREIKRYWLRKADWARVSGAAAELVGAFPGGLTVADVDSWSEQRRLTGLNRCAFNELFLRPIIVELASETADGSCTWTDGQHRGALIIRAGVDRVAIFESWTRSP